MATDSPAASEANATHASTEATIEARWDARAGWIDMVQSRNADAALISQLSRRLASTTTDGDNNDVRSAGLMDHLLATGAAGDSLNSALVEICCH